MFSCKELDILQAHGIKRGIVGWMSLMEKLSSKQQLCSCCWFLWHLDTASSFVHKIIFPVQLLHAEMEAVKCVKEMVLTENTQLRCS